MRDKDLLKLLQDNGWVTERVKGSHHMLKKGGQMLVIPIHGKDVKPGLLNKILKDAGLK